MTITLTKAIRVAGAAVPVGTTATYAADFEADLVQRGHATYAAGSPSFPGREVPLYVTTTSAQGIVISEGRKLAAESCDFFSAGRNLFDSSTITVGYVINASGAILANALYTITDYIPVAGNAQYSKYSDSGVGFNYVNYFDENKVFLSRADYLTRTITTPSAARYCRLSFQGAVEPPRKMFHAGAAQLVYAPYEKTLSDVGVSDVLLKRIGNEVGVTQSDRIVLSDTVRSTFTTSDTFSGYADFTSTTAAQVYAMYDALVSANPGYATKTALGNDLFSNPISAYTFSMAGPSAAIAPKKPKIFITTGTHGYEHPPALIAYLFFAALCEAGTEQLANLKAEVNFVIIPVVNPSGWNDYTRKNRNGVDVARNFPEGWTLGAPADVTYGGPSPLSEKESQYVKATFDAHPDILAFYDFHNFAGAAGEQNFIWVASQDGYVQHMAATLIARMTKVWRDRYAWIPAAPYFAGYTDSTSGAMSQDHARGRGIPFSATIEVGGRWWIQPAGTPYNTEHKVCGVETFVNWLLINLVELQRRA